MGEPAYILEPGTGADVISVGEPEFFAPADTSLLDALLGEYRQAREHIGTVAAFMGSSEMQRAAEFFFAACEDRFARFVPSISKIFDAAAATRALDARYWDRALDLTDVRDHMPAARRREWHERIKAMDTPEFTEENARATLESLLAQRANYLAERVDGIFQGLSGEHVTNRPEGFSKRMIIDSVFMYDTLAIGWKADLIHDLRSVIAKLMGRDQPYHQATSHALASARRNPGEWHRVDGGAFRLRVYKKGTAHIEVHPEIAWRLNRILAYLHPAAIPESHRRQPKHRVSTREHRLFDRPIAFAVLKLIDGGRFDTQRRTLTLGYEWSEADKHLRQRVSQVLQAIGGAEVSGGVFAFDYDASEVIGELLVLGAIPDRQSYQYYPTPRWLAEQMVELAEIGEQDRCLEPSAGQGAIAGLMPAGRTVCVEASPLHCRVLTSRGLDVCQADFLRWGETRQFDVICMNPPFSEGRAKAHLEHAAKLLAPGGRLVAVLPASLAGKNLLPGLSTSYSSVYDGAFCHASVSVVVLTARKPALA